MQQRENDQPIKKSHSFALAYGVRRGLSIEDAEDLAQNYVMKKYVLKKAQRLAHCYVDFMRKVKGDPRKACWHSRPYASFDREMIVCPAYIAELLMCRRANMAQLTVWQKYCVWQIVLHGQMEASRRTGIKQNRLAGVLRRLRRKAFLTTHL